MQRMLGRDRAGSALGFSPLPTCSPDLCLTLSRPCQGHSGQAPACHLLLLPASSTVSHHCRQQPRSSRGRLFCSSKAGALGFHSPSACLVLSFSIFIVVFFMTTLESSTPARTRLAPRRRPGWFAPLRALFGLLSVVRGA